MLHHAVHSWSVWPCYIMSQRIGDRAMISWYLHNHRGILCHCTMCTLFSIFFRATEQAQTYLKIWVWHPIKHVFVPACSSVRKVHLFTFLWFWNSRYVISPKICPCILPFFPKYAPSSSSSSLGHSRPSASLSTTNIVDLLSTIIVLF